MGMYNASILIFLLAAYMFLGKTVAQCTDTVSITIVPNNGHYAVTEDHILKGHDLSSIQTRSANICAGRCTRDEDCKSFNYSPNTRMCELNDGNHVLNPGDLEPDTSSKYFYYVWSRFTGCNFSTPIGQCFQFLFPRLPDGTTRIEFSVRTNIDAFIGLTTENRITDPMYVIDIGGNGGIDIFIRRCKGCVNAHQVTFPTLISALEYRRYWITFENGLIQIGRHNSNIPLTEWQDPEVLFPIHYVSFASWYVETGDWVLHSFCDAPSEWQT